MFFGCGKGEGGCEEDERGGMKMRYSKEDICDVMPKSGEWISGREIMNLLDKHLGTDNFKRGSRDPDDCELDGCSRMGEIKELVCETLDTIRDGNFYIKMSWLEKEGRIERKRISDLTQYRLKPGERPPGIDESDHFPLRGGLAWAT